MQAFYRVFCRHPNLSSLMKAEHVVHWRNSTTAASAAASSSSVADRERQNYLLELSSRTTKWDVSPPNVMKAVKQCPELMKYSPSEWDTIFSTFEYIGFKGSETLEVLKKCPLLLGTDPKNISAIWHALTIFKLTTPKLVQALVYRPYVLCNSPKEADDKALAIVNFVGAKNNALHVLNMCNNPFGLSLTELKEVIVYVQNVMKVRRTYEICRSKVVECPLSKLKCRHTFLVDCGLYIPQDDDVSVTVPHSNPLLCNIVNPNDEVFATKTAKLTYEEYLVFQELFERKKYDEIYGDTDDF